MDKRDLTRAGKELRNDEEDAMVANLLSCCSGGEDIDVGGRGRAVERGFGGSWLMGGGGGSSGGGNNEVIDIDTPPNSQKSN